MCIRDQESSALHAEGFEIRSADAPVDPRGLVGQVAAIAQVYDVLAGDAEDARGFAGGQEDVADGGGRFVVDDLTHGLSCLLYTSDAADDLTRVDLGGRRIIKKK